MSVKHYFKVVDHFYPNPQKIRQAALRRSFHQPEGMLGMRSRPYYPAGVKRRIERDFGVKITEWLCDPKSTEVGNGVIFYAFSRGKYGEQVAIHADDPLSWITMLIYLTPNAPIDAGTSFWRHKKTGLAHWPSRADAKRLKMPLWKLEDLLESECRNPKKWDEIDRVGNLFNRAVFYPGGMFHSATRRFGSHVKNGRLYQLFHFPVK